MSNGPLRSRTQLTLSASPPAYDACAVPAALVSVLAVVDLLAPGGGGEPGRNLVPYGFPVVESVTAARTVKPDPKGTARGLTEAVSFGR